MSKKPKICVGLSGGVDSSVAALLLKRQGYDVFAMFMQNWHDADATLHGDCEWEEDRFVAELVARKIGIPFYFVDLSKEYRKRVVDYMFDEYSKGRTPNPDVLCNREIKFDAFLREAEKLGADMVATGHYCRKEILVGDDGMPVLDADGEPVVRILEGADKNKDQSYFLCQLTQAQLRKALFPIGHLTKPQVREIAKEAELESAGKKDSQGICFVGKVDLPTFLQQKLRPHEGDVVEVYDRFYQDSTQYEKQRAIMAGLLDGESEPVMITDYISEDKSSPAEDGRRNVFSQAKIAPLATEELELLATPMSYTPITFETETYRSGKHHTKKTRIRPNPWGMPVGKHDGAEFYTIGQRKGLDIGGHKESIFVIANDIPRNIVYVGEGHRHKGLSRSCLRIDASEVHWIRLDKAMRDGEIRKASVRIRYRQPLQDAWLICRDGAMFILFASPQRGVTPGQFAVWYGADGEMLGSGPIAQ